MLLQVENTIELTVSPDLLPKASLETLFSTLVQNDFTSSEWEQKWRRSIVDRKAREYGKPQAPLVVYLRAEDQDGCNDWLSRLEIATA
jgi:hypothetical protein